MIPLRIFKVHFSSIQGETWQGHTGQGRVWVTVLPVEEQLAADHAPFLKSRCSMGPHSEVALQNQRCEPRPGFPHREMEVGSSG